MDIQTILSISGAVLASLGGGALIVFGASAWLGKVWANRLLENDKLENSKELTSIKSQLDQAQNDRIRKLESKLKHYERQIEEFYGPLFNAVHQIFIANHIQYDLLKATSNNGEKHLSLEDIEKVRRYYHSSYFNDLHSQVRQIIGTKLYLIEGTTMPESFYQYLKHSAQEADQRVLWEEYQIDTSFLKGHPWPKNFYSDIKDGFEKSMKRYQECLDGINA